MTALKCLEWILKNKTQSILTVIVVFLYIANFRIQYMHSSRDYYNFKPCSTELPEIRQQEHTFLNNTRSGVCKRPKLQPYSETVKKYLYRTEMFDECDKFYPLLFNSTLDGEIVPVKTLNEFAKHRIKSCCYQVVERDREETFADKTYKMRPKCISISLEKRTKIPTDHEFISISCKSVKYPSKNSTKGKSRRKTVDMHAFVNLKPEVEKRLNEALRENKDNGRKRVNVIIFGMDSVSRMNFLRTMPQSYEYLMKTLNAVDLEGYNKLAENTFPNVMPMLTSLSETEIDQNCGKNKSYDTCPFIWKTYEKHGYVTSYAEDDSPISALNYEKNGFVHPPTDHYLRNFGVAANAKIAAQVLISSKLCYGPRMAFEVLLDYMKKYTYQFSRRSNTPFFQFTWTTSLTHDYLHTGELGDKPLLLSLKWLKGSGYLNDTIFILMSDHGQRAHKFRNSIQGQLEDFLPVAIFVIPEWLKTGKYFRAYQNLLRNSDKLVTTYDFHQVLLDLLDLKSLENEQVLRREVDLLQAERKHELHRGISLFLPVPVSRTCKMAEIEPNFCSCDYFKPVSVRPKIINTMASIAIKKINSLLAKSLEVCAVLSLNSIQLALQVGQHGSGGEWKGYKVTFETKPGGGMFEALVQKESNKTQWNVAGTITRTNRYGNQSHCVHDNLLKLYCYCKDYLEIKQNRSANWNET